MRHIADQHSTYVGYFGDGFRELQGQKAHDYLVGATSPTLLALQFLAGTTLCDASSQLVNHRRSPCESFGRVGLIGHSWTLHSCFAVAQPLTLLLRRHIFVDFSEAQLPHLCSSVTPSNSPQCSLLYDQVGCSFQR